MLRNGLPSSSLGRGTNDVMVAHNFLAVVISVRIWIDQPFFFKENNAHESSNFSMTTEKRNEVMNSRDFFDMVCRMRKAQKSYFKTRDRDALNLSKEIEKQVDEEINRVNRVLAKKGMPYISLEN